MKVVHEGDVAPLGEEGGEGFALAVSDLQGEKAVWLKQGVSLGDEAAVDVQTLRAAEERGGGFVVADLRVESGPVGLGDVGGIAGDSVEGVLVADGA